MHKKETHLGTCHGHTGFGGQWHNAIPYNPNQSVRSFPNIKIVQQAQ
jgi:hypothetical protein